MAEETGTQAAATEGAPQEAQFVIQRIYVKDVSFEAPHSPRCSDPDQCPVSILR